MAYVNFKNSPSEETPLTGGATGNLNVMQENGTSHGADTKLGYAQSFLNDHLVNVSNEVDEDYRVNLLKGKNLYDKNTYVLNNGLWSSSSNIGTNSSGWYVVVPIVGGKTYTISKKNSGVLYTTTTAIYPSNGVAKLDTWGGGDNLSSRTITTNSNAKFLFIGLLASASPTAVQKATAIEELQVEEGETATTYEEFVPNSIKVNGYDFTETIGIGTSVNSSYRTNIIKGNNLFDVYSMIEIVSKYRTWDAGTISNNASYVGLKIPVKPNTTYSTYGNGAYSNLAYYDKGFNYLSGEVYSYNSGDSASFTTPSNCYFITLALQKTTTEFMLNYGDISLPYESYVIPSIVVDNEEIYSKDNIEQYSTSEIRIGTWIDGKPLYRKVVNFGALPNNAAKQYSLSGMNIDFMKEVKGTAYTSQKNGFNIPYPVSGATTHVTIYWDANNVSVITSNDRSAYSVYLILEYTKTTD